jgi:PAS domain S-box-containing protein
MKQITEFFEKIFDSSDWPPRWHCGQWSQFHGWLYIISDLLIWSAYFIIPLVILRYISSKHGIKFVRLYFLFAAFILACGATHFLDAVAFWIPMYRLNALFRFITAVVSWVTVFYLAKYLPFVFSLKKQKELDIGIFHKESEANLKKIKNDYQLLVSSVKDYAIFLLDIEGHVASWNSGAENIKGYTAEEIIGKPMDVFYTPEEKASGEPINNLQSALEYGHFETEGLRVRKNGSTFYADVVFTSLYDEVGKLYGFAKVTKDITEKRKAAEELERLNAKLIISINKTKESEERFRNVVEQATNPIFILKGEDLKLELANDPLLKLWNTGKESIGKPFLEIIPEMKGQPFVELLMDVLHNGITHYGTEQPAYFIRKNEVRETFYFNYVYLPYRENDKTISGIIIQSTDVSAQVLARKKIEAIASELIIANEELSFQNSEKEKRAAELLIANEELSFQNSEKEKRAAELLIANEELSFQNREKEKRASELLIANIELSFQDKEKEKRSAELLVANEELGRSKILLSKSNEELEAFTYSVSHDLRAPLRGIFGFTAILEEDYVSKLDGEAKRVMAVIKRNTVKMGYLIDDLLAFSRMGKQEIQKTSIDTNEMIAGVVSELRGQNRADRKISWDIHKLPFMYADRNTIRQVWINLISNAIKYSGKNNAPHIIVGSYPENDRTVFYVRDNGVGFEEKYYNKLFKVFQRLHNAKEFEGTGVGLALVEKIVSKHGGRVWANAIENEGASFYFSLPL